MDLQRVLSSHSHPYLAKRHSYSYLVLSSECRFSSYECECEYECENRRGRAVLLGVPGENFTRRYFVLYTVFSQVWRCPHSIAEVLPECILGK